MKMMPDSTAAGSAHTIPMLTFSLGEQHYAIHIDDVVEVAAMVDVVRVADAPAEIVGAVNRHGQVMVLLDLRRVMASGPVLPIDLDTLFIVARHGARLAGLVVDAVHQVEYVPREKLSKSTGASRYIRGIISYESRIVQILEPGPLLEDFLAEIVLDDGLEVDR